MIVIEAQEIDYNFLGHSDLYGRTPLKVIDYDCSYPKHLVLQAYKWFCEFAKEAHIDTSFYQYITITKQDPIWHISFFTNDKQEGISYNLSEIYYDSRNKKILQAIQVLS